jgi:hypothetical protein
MVDNTHNTNITINLVVQPEDGSVEFVGLPKQFQYPMNMFDDKEKLANPLLVLQAAIRDAEQGLVAKKEGI